MWSLCEIWTFLTTPEAANGFTSLAAIATIVSILLGGLAAVAVWIYKRRQQPTTTQEMDQRIKAIEKKKHVKYKTLRKALGKLAARIPNDQLLDAIEEWANELVSLRENLSKSSNDAPETAALRQQALALLDDGELEKARALLAKANDNRRENRQQRNREDAGLLISQAEFERLLFNHNAAIHLLEEAAQLDPENWSALMNLGDALATIGNRQKAQDAFAKARALAAAQGLERQESIALNRLADMLKTSDPRQALENYKLDLGIAKRLADADPQNMQYQRDLSVSYNKIADMLKTSDPLQALENYERGFDIRKRLAETEPQILQYQRDLSINYNNIADMLKTGDPLKALGKYELGLGIAKRLAEADPQNLEYQRDLSVSYNKIADILRTSDARQALENYKLGLGIFGRLAKSDPQNLEYQRDLAISFMKLAEMDQSPKENWGKAHDIFVVLREKCFLSATDQQFIEVMAEQRDAAAH